MAVLVAYQRMEIPSATARTCGRMQGFRAVRESGVGAPSVAGL
jgi:hypothetical protein